MTACIVEEVHSIIQLHGLVPVVRSRISIKAVVSGSFCRHFFIAACLLVIEVDVSGELLSREIIEVIVRAEVHGSIVIFSQISDAFRFRRGVILAGHMVRDKVNDHFQSGSMCAFHQRFKFTHTLSDVYGQIRIHVIVIADCIR